MTLTEYPVIEQRSEKWFELRRGIVTASVVGTLLTPTLRIADNEKSRGLTASLVGERITAYTERGYVSFDMQRGIDDEPRAREVYAEHFAPVREVGFMVREESGWRLGYSPDGLVGDDGLIEVKSRKQRKQVETVLSESGVPEENMAQLQAGLLVSGRKWCDYISFSGGMHLWVKRVYPDPDWQDAITAALIAFEKNAEAMTSTYLERVTGLPMTERSPDPFDVELTL
ncbi:lambda exonuclease family protein [Nocardioides montaniterrae]